MWVGSLAYAPQWSALALAVGAGAILQVIIEVGLYLRRSDGRGTSALLSPPVLGGLGGWRRLHVRDRDAGEDLRRRRRDQVALIRRAQSASQF